MNTYNPILKKEEVSRWRILQPRPIPDPETALVLSAEGQSLLVIKEGEKGPTSGEMLWGKYNLVYTIDTSKHPLRFACSLPCKTDAFDFQADVNFTCKVSDPLMIVRDNIRDVIQVLKPLSEEMMRTISRKHEVEDSGAAEREISDYIKKAEFKYKVGLSIEQFTVSLFLEQEARDRIREKKRIQEEIELEKVRQNLEKQKAQLEIDKAKQRELLELERIRQRNQFQREEQKTQIQGELELQKLKQDLEFDKTQFEIIQARQKEQLELELRRQREKFELESMELKMRFYAPILQGGNFQLLALQLVQSPQDVKVILQTLNQQKQSERDHQLKMLKMLLDEDALEGSQINEVGKSLLRQLVGLTEQSTAILESSSVDTPEVQEALPEAETTNNDNSVVDIPEEFRRDD
ncbi:MAG: hypothetical protein RM338_31280 [Nostoc sp. DedQUE12a]|nr:hypothetical protein [Nostoc sp. DedQUE12a]